MKTFSGKEVLQKIINGENTEDDFEIGGDKYWRELDFASILVSHMISDEYRFRIKKTMREINGFSVPIPLKEPPPAMTKYFLIDLSNYSFSANITWNNLDIEQMWLERGLIFLEKEDAVANAKAMLGINPEQE